MNTIEEEIQYVVKFFILTFKLFGLLPIITTKKYYYFSYIYSIIIFIFIEYIYYSTSFFYRYQYKFSYENVSQIVNTIMKLMKISIVLMLFLMYTCQLKDFQKHLSYNDKIQKYLTKINNILGNNLKSYCKNKLRKYVTSIIMIFIFFSIGTIYRGKFKADTHATVNFGYLPINFIIYLMVDFYWGIMLVFTYFFKQINFKIKIIIENAQLLVKRAEQRDFGKIYFMQKYCDLSDRLDEMESIHFKLSIFVLQFNMLWSKQLLFFLIWRFADFVFNLYAEIMTILRFENLANISGFLVTNGIVIIVQFWTLISVVHSCADVTKEVNFL